MSAKFFTLLFLIVLSTSRLAHDPFTTLIAYQAKQRAVAEISNSEYGLLPFKLVDQPQHFILAPTKNEEVRVEVVVHWISTNAALKFPSFKLTEKVRIIIEQENFSSVPQKTLLKKEFLTQTGFRFNAKAGKRYRCRIESAGKQIKLVEIAMTRHYQSSTMPLDRNRSSINHTFLQQMRENLVRAQSKWAEREVNDEPEVEKMCFWMSGLEMISLAGLLIIQLILFERFSFSSSVV